MLNRRIISPNFYAAILAVKCQFVRKSPEKDSEPAVREARKWTPKERPTETPSIACQLSYCCFSFARFWPALILWFFRSCSRISACWVDCGSGSQCLFCYIGCTATAEPDQPANRSLNFCSARWQNNITAQFFWGFWGFSWGVRCKPWRASSICWLPRRVLGLEASGLLHSQTISKELVKKYGSTFKANISAPFENSLTAIAAGYERYDASRQETPGTSPIGAGKLPHWALWRFTWTTLAGTVSCLIFLFLFRTVPSAPPSDVTGQAENVVENDRPSSSRHRQDTFHGRYALVDHSL